MREMAWVHPTLLFAMRGHVLRGHVLRHDPYVTSTYSRDDGKLTLNVALNARTPHEAAACLVHNTHGCHGLDYTKGRLKDVRKRPRSPRTSARTAASTSCASIGWSLGW